MIAVMIIGLIAVTLHRFVGAVLNGVMISSEREEDSERMTALFRYIDAQLDAVPTRGSSLIVGTPHKFGTSLNSDELQWRCEAGAGTLTSAAAGEWFATLTVMPQTKGSSKLDLGLRRRNTQAAEQDFTWIPLLKDVAGLKFEYFDPRLNAWLDRWNDPNSRPLLVRMQLWRTKESLPERAVFTINSALVQP
jgi:hypothetical protein